MSHILLCHEQVGEFNDTLPFISLWIIPLYVRFLFCGQIKHNFCFFMQEFEVNPYR